MTKIPPGSSDCRLFRLGAVMENPIVEKILKEGIDSVNLSMLDDNARKRIMGIVGEKLYKQNKFLEAIEIMTMANDIEGLLRLGDSFLSEGRAELATSCFMPTKDKQRLNNAALLCIKAKNYALAAKAYEAADNKEMASFINENFA